MATFDVVIVGNGALGHATARALTLRDPKLKVAILGEAHRPRAASTAAGAMLGAFGETTWALLQSPSGRSKLDKSVKAARMWTDWIGSINAELPASEHALIRRGTYIINNSRGGQLDDENYQAIRDACKEYSEPYEDVDPTAIQGLNPMADGRPLRAMFIPGEGFIDSGRLLNAYTKLAERSSQISLIRDTAKSLVTSKGKIDGVLGKSGETYAAAQVVLAAGVGTQDLLDELPDLARRIPRLFSGGGTSLVLDTEWTGGTYRPPMCEHVIRTPNRSLACGLHAVPRSETQLYIGATNYLSMKPWDRPNVSDMYFLLECAMEQISQDLVWSTLVTWNAGNRPVPIDCCPLLGAVPSLPGLFMLTGTFRDGLHLSPLLSQDLAARMAGQPGLYHNVFEPERKPIQTLTREQAVTEILKHYKAAMFEHKAINGTKIGFHNIFPRWQSDTAQMLYQQLDTDYVLPPEFFPILDAQRATAVPFFRKYYADVKAAWE